MFSEVYRNQFLLKISQMKFNGKLILNNFIYLLNKKVKNNNNPNNLLQGQNQNKNLGTPQGLNRKDQSEDMTIEEIINKAINL